MRVRQATVVSVAAFVAPLALYLAFATRTLQGGDSAELALLSARGGVAHPPGYPLWTILARIAGALPLGAPAWRAALPSAVCGAAAVWVLYRIGLALTRGAHAPSLAGALAFAVAPLAWKAAGVPEVFSLLALSAAAVILAALRLRDADAERMDGAPASRVRRAHALGWAVGLGLANHHTLVLCLPIVLWGLADCLRSERRVAVRGLAAFAAGGALGLLPYALLPLFAATAGEDAFVWGAPGSLRGLADHFLRREYGTFRLAVSGEELRPLHHASAFAAAVPGQLFYLHFVAAVAGAVVCVRARPGFAAALLASLVLAGAVFPALFNLPESRIAAEVAERFLLLPLLIASVLIAPGLDWAARRFAHRPSSPFSSPAFLAVAFAPLPFAALVAWPHARWSADPTVERYLIAALREVEPRAVIVGEGDVLGPGVRWVSAVLGERPDVDYLDVNLVRRRWYWERTRARIPEFDLAYDAERTHLGELVERLSVDRVVYVTASLASRLGTRFPAQPAGFFARVPRPAPLPLAELDERLARATAALGNLPDPPIDAWSASFRSAAALSWSALGKEHEAAGNPAAAARCAANAAALAR